MTTEQTQPAAGTGGDSSENIPPTTKDSVAYETHRKLLDEKKKLQQRLDAFESERKAADEAEMVRKGELQKLLELERKKSQELDGRVKAQDEERKQARKLSAIVKGLGAPVDQKWYSVIGSHLDDVIVNEETGEVEGMSVTSVIENLKKEWPEMLRRPAAGMPQDAPRGNGASTISHDEWKKLPLAEMKKYKPHQII
jgi:hypothetical protein